jgi:hypothetical protein
MSADVLLAGGLRRDAYTNWDGSTVPPLLNVGDFTASSSVSPPGARDRIPEADSH